MKLDRAERDAGAEAQVCDALGSRMQQEWDVPLQPFISGRPRTGFAEAQASDVPR